MKKLVIFGLGEQAQLAHFYFTNDSDYDVVGFVVDKEYVNCSDFCGLPVVSMDVVEQHFPAEAHSAFIAAGYNEVNRLRERKYVEMKAKGYPIASYISSKAVIWTTDIGENCFLLEDNTIQPFVKIGNNVTLWSGNHIGHHSVIEDHCFITSHVVVSGGVTVGHHTFIGVNATLRDHIRIGASNVIGGGAVIMGSTSDDEVYLPARAQLYKLKSHELKGI